MKAAMIASIFWLKTRQGWRKSLPGEEMKFRDLHAESHQLIAQGFEALGRALIDLRYAERTTRVGQELLVIAGKLTQATAPRDDICKAVVNPEAPESSFRERFFSTQLGEIPAVRRFFADHGLMECLSVMLAPWGDEESKRFDLALALLELVILAERQAKARPQTPEQPSPGERGTSSQS